tara:strand:- start:185863 stop:186744 length:882 start_codon:yes stop_codon:yes gene_type:complete
MENFKTQNKMQSEKDTKTKSENNIKQLIGFSNWEMFGIGILVILIIFSPIVLSTFNYSLGFSSSGEVGDTIGGITAPFVNLLAAYLVFKSFTAQIRANAQQREDHEEQMKQLNKEHSFTYISNYYNLIKSKYTRRPEDQILGWSKLYHTKMRFAEIFDTDTYKQATNDLNITHENPTVREETKKIKLKLEHNIKFTNSNVTPDLIQVLNQLETLIMFIEESEKSNLDKGLQYFYKLELEKILYDVELYHLFDESYLEVINNCDTIISDQNKILIKEIIELATKLTQKNYQIRK